MLSIIIPALNEEKYIKKCLQSITQQITELEYEIIVVDNSSTDNTVKIAHSFKAKVVSEPIKGLARAKNTGARHARGDFLCFVDADCTLPKGYLNRIAHCINKFPKVDAFSGPCVYLDGGALIGFITQNLNYFYFYHRLVKLITGIQSLTGGNTIVKKAAFNQVSGFNNDLNNILSPEDLDFSIRLNKAGYKALFLPDLFIYSSFRRYKKSNFKDGVSRFFQTVRMLKT